MQGKKRVWMWLVVIAGAVLAVQTGGNIWRLWRLGGRVVEAQKQVEQAKTENGQLQAQLNYVQSPEFVEKEARDKLGYGREGETIVVVPNDKTQIINDKSQNNPKSESNWRKWRKLYLGF